ncbi:Hypothetical protein FKW44_019110 [Caligus rogercresseyi]|uniref:Uncharacterized protein n=1 Tax=Caligus rogercresseyi TaxID=217165 RepID=A0A7T8GVG1_CALRO|nr:Hypothetical protein FKW44_019110 [Caligus rogercresseyi]
MSHEKKSREKIADLLKAKVDKKKILVIVGCSLATVYNVQSSKKMKMVLAGSRQ